MHRDEWLELTAAHLVSSGEDGLAMRKFRGELDPFVPAIRRLAPNELLLPA